MNTAATTINNLSNNVETKVKQICDALAAIGVSLCDASGNFKDMITVFKEISEAVYDSDASPKELKDMLGFNTDCCCCSTTTATNNQLYNQLNTTSNIAQTITSNTMSIGTNTTADTKLHYNTGGIVDWSNWTIPVDGITIQDCFTNMIHTPKEEEKNKKEEEKKKMKNLFDFNFGPVTNGTVAMSMQGMAVVNADNKYVTYDSEKNEIVDVTPFTIENDNFKLFYMIPVALKDVTIGDIIVHQGNYCFVVDGDENTLDVINISHGTAETIFPVKSPFGFNFVTKIISLFNFNTANKDNPFGNMLPFILMKDNKDSNMLPLVMMCGQGNTTFDINNPMMMYFLMKDGKNSDLLPFLLMQSKK